MLYAESQADANARNHPGAVRMAVIAFINYNLVIACMWGSFSLLLGPVEQHLGINRNLSALGAPAINLAAALCAPLAGILATRFSLRLIMLAGSILTVAGYAVLSLTTSYPLYLLAFGLLLGPGMAAAVILPGTLVTRWFAVNRGKALGIVTMPAVIGGVPILTSWMLRAHGLQAAYTALAALSVLSVIVNFFIIDRPPADPAVSAASTAAQAAAGAPGMGQLLASPRFWALFIAFAASSTGSITLGAHLVPMARNWGLTTASGATLLSIFFFSAIPGTLFFGWLADRLGAVPTLAILVLNTAVLWIIMLFHPSFALLCVIISIIGADGAGVVPVFGVALSEAFGRESFSRAYGLANLFCLPFTVICIPAAAFIYTSTGSYAGAILVMALFLGLSGLAASSAWRRRALQPAGLAG